MSDRSLASKAAMTTAAAAPPAADVRVGDNPPAGCDAGIAKRQPSIVQGEAIREEKH